MPMKWAAIPGIFIYDMTRPPFVLFSYVRGSLLELWLYASVEHLLTRIAHKAHLPKRLERYLIYPVCSAHV